MRFSVTYRDVKASHEVGPSPDISAGDEFTIEVDADNAVDAAKVIQNQPGRGMTGINILSVTPIAESDQESANR
ncbi:MAG: hypothetical protein IT338_10930 [Thermomicrobiales bacterium]|nr:hypothetical protein [Thermomicrobiales bacterium]